MLTGLFIVLGLSAHADTLFGRDNDPKIPTEAPFTLTLHTLERLNPEEILYRATRDGFYAIEGRATLESLESGETRALIDEQVLAGKGACEVSTRARTYLAFDSSGALAGPKLILTSEANPCEPEASERVVLFKRREALAKDSIWLSSLSLSHLASESPEVPELSALPGLLSLQLFWEPALRSPFKTKVERIGELCAQTLSITVGQLTLRIWDEINATQGLTRVWPLILEQSLQSSPSLPSGECTPWSLTQWQEHVGDRARLKVAPQSRSIALAVGSFLLELDFDPVDRSLELSTQIEDGELIGLTPDLSQYLLSTPLQASLKKTELAWSRLLRLAWLPVVD
jgi:hypothetical protein